MWEWGLGWKETRSGMEEWRWRGGVDGQRKEIGLWRRLKEREVRLWRGQRADVHRMGASSSKARGKVGRLGKGAREVRRRGSGSCHKMRGEDQRMRP